MIVKVFNVRTCGNCSFNDGICYTSYPAKYRCTFDNGYYEGFHPCHFELMPVRYAKWIHMKDYDSPLDSTWMCSGCEGKVITDYGDSPINHGFAHCPHCGAKMDGGEQYEA